MDESGYRSTLGAFWQQDGKLTEFRRQLSTEYAYEVHRSVLRDDNAAARTLALGQSILAQQNELPSAWYLKSSPRQHQTMILELLKSLPVTAWPSLDSVIDTDDPWLDSHQLANSAWALLTHKPGPWPQDVAAELAKIALTLQAQADPHVIAAAAFRHKEVLNLVTERAATWTGKPKLIYQLALTRHHHPSARIGWAYASIVQDVLEALLSDSHIQRVNPVVRAPE